MIDSEVWSSYITSRYRSDNDTTVSNLQANSNSLRLIRADSDLFQVQSFDFCGHTFSVVSLEPGGKLYTFTAGGQISAQMSRVSNSKLVRP